MIFAIEGIDAAGKATQAQNLQHRLCREMNTNDVLMLSFPDYESTFGKAIKKYLGGEIRVTGLNLYQGLVFQALQTADRYEKSELISRFAGNKDKHLVLDRYYLSGIVYGWSDGIIEDLLWDVHEALPRPDAWILIDVSVEEASRRRPDKRDFIEANRDKMLSISQKYQQIFLNQKLKHKMNNMFVVDGNNDETVVSREIWGRIKELI